MKIAVVGTGYVGLVTGACFSDCGVDVTCVDNDAAKIAGLRRGEIPIFEPGLEALVHKNSAAGRLHFTTDTCEAIAPALVVFIAVGTPSGPGGTADLSYVDQVARTIGTCLASYKVVVTKSTVPVGTGERVRRIIQESTAGEHGFDMASNPEFLREGSAISDFLRPDRVVIGAGSDRAITILKDLYTPLFRSEVPFVVTSVASAEMIKYSSNAFLALKISYINEIADLCEKVGADVFDVAQGMGLDRRIGPQFLQPGPGFGGSCFPKDTRALATIAEEHGCSLLTVHSAMEVNRRRIESVLGKVRCLLPEIVGRTVAVLGLAFKPETDDVREAPALEIIRALRAAGALIRAYDPVAMPAARKVLGEGGIAWARDAYDAVRGADLLLLITEWNEFRHLDLHQVRNTMRSPLVVDTRNVYRYEAMSDLGFTYLAVGRPCSCIVPRSERP